MKTAPAFEVTFRVLLGRAQDTLPKLNGGKITQVQEYIVEWPAPPSEIDVRYAADGIREWLTSFGHSVIAVRYPNSQPLPTLPVFPPYVPPYGTTGDDPLRGQPTTVCNSGEATPDTLTGVTQPQLLETDRQRTRWTAAEDRKLMTWTGTIEQLATELGRTVKACQVRHSLLLKRMPKKKKTPK
jgi:hypothetical protein